ncbi:hypothetical protein GCM10009646_60820 [Streptomyces aureus]
MSDVSNKSEISGKGDRDGTALVLGGGGPVGGAWMTGVLAGLADAGIDLLSADVVIGTSAGAIYGARLACGESARESYERQLARADRIDLPVTTAQTLRFLWAALGSRDSQRSVQRLGRAALAARTPPEADVRPTIATLLRDATAWPGDTDLRITAIDAHTGSLEAFDAAGQVTLAEAVAASCAVPIVWPPASAAGRRWIDGGSRATANIHLAQGCRPRPGHCSVDLGAGPAPERPAAGGRTGGRGDRHPVGVPGPYRPPRHGAQHGRGYAQARRRTRRPCPGHGARRRGVPSLEGVTEMEKPTQPPTLNDLAPDGHDMAANPYAVYAALRDKGPVHRVLVPESGEAWLVVTRDAARAALTDPRLRNDIRHSSSWHDDGGHAIGRNMLQTDPPQHTRLRHLVAGHFTPGRITALRPRIEAIATDLLAELPHHGTVDLVSAYALPLPVTVICDLLGIPASDRAAFHAWSNALVMPENPEHATSAATELTAYLAKLIEHKRRTPDSALLSILATADTATGHAPPTREELLGMAFLLLVAGHETTVNLISGTLHALLTHPDQLDLLRAEPELTGAAIEESLRYNSPVHASAFRFAAEPLDIAGTHIPAGDAVLISLAAASRDPLHFPDPDRFDIRRAPNSHLGFGHGLHHCLGAPLARAEATIALRRLLHDRPTLAFATDPATLTWRTSALLRGLTELPLRVD